MARDEYIAHLRAVPLFASCTTRQLTEIGRVADELLLPPGHVLMEQGALGVELFIIVDGTAEVLRDGKRIAEVGAGQFVGEMAVLSDVRRNATVRAVTSLDVLVLLRRSLVQLLDDVPGLAKHLLFEVASRIDSTSDGGFVGNGTSA